MCRPAGQPQGNRSAVFFFIILLLTLFSAARPSFSQCAPRERPISALCLCSAKSKARPAVCAKPKPTALAGGCPAMGFMLPSSAKAGGLQFTHGRRAPDDWLVGFNVGATNRTGQAYAAFRRGAGPRGVTARYRTAPPGARQTPRSPRPVLHRPLRYPKTPRRFLRPRA